MGSDWESPWTPSCAVYRHFAKKSNVLVCLEAQVVAATSRMGVQVVWPPVAPPFRLSVSWPGGSTGGLA